MTRASYQIKNIIVCGIAAGFFVLLVMMLSSTGIADPEKAKTDQKTELFPPKNIMSIIKEYCSTCAIVSLNDLAEEAKTEFLDMYPKGNPGWVKGDFNGDGITDYALLLSNKEGNNAYLRLVVLLSSGKKFTIKKLIERQGYSFWYISSMPAGTVVKHTRAFAPPSNEPREVKLRYPAIEYFKAGSSMSVFYFENGKFHMIPVSY